MKPYSFKSKSKNKVSMPVEMMDGTKLNVLLPDKGLYELVQSLKTTDKADFVETLKDLVIMVLANNKTKTEVTSEMLDGLDIEEQADFLAAYMEFVGENLTGKN